MNKKRIYEILQNKEIKDIYYNDEPVWIQEVHGNVAKVGFLNFTDYQDIHIDDLYEKNLFQDPHKQL